MVPRLPACLCVHPLRFSVKFLSLSLSLSLSLCLSVYSISRFHVLIKRVAEPFAGESAAAASSATVVASSIDPVAAPIGVGVPESSSADPKRPFRYYIMDLGSLNGVYIDNIKIRHNLWTPLNEGARIRFAPRTKLAKDYAAAIQAADDINQRSLQASIAAGGTGAHGTYRMTGPVVPMMPLSVKDLHIEFIFTHGVNVHGQMRLAQINGVVAAGHEVNGALQESLGAAAHSVIGMTTMPTLTANAASPTINKALVAMDSTQSASAAAAATSNNNRSIDSDSNNNANASSSSSSNAASHKRSHESINDTVSPQDNKRARTSAPGELSTTTPVACDEDKLLPLSYVQSMDTSTTRSGTQDPSASACTGAGASVASSLQSHVDSVFEEFTCGICTDIIYKFVALECGHSFCGGCIDKWFKKKKACPICRAVHEGATRPARAVDNVICMMVQQNCTAAKKAERAERIIKADADAKHEEEEEQQKRKRAHDQRPVMEEDEDDEDDGGANEDDDDEDEEEEEEEAAVMVPAVPVPVRYGEMRAAPLTVGDDAGSIIYQFAPAVVAPAIIVPAAAVPAVV